jgi:sortase (surface protein transpeptidase)
MRQHRPLVAVLTLVAFAAALGCFGYAAALALPATKSSQTRRALPVPSAHVAARELAGISNVRGKQEPRPVRIVIPAIGVNAPVIPLNLNRAGTLQVPKSFTQTGWFVGGPEPGENGPAVIVGHVDSTRGPAVFYRIRGLHRGDKINVVLRNKSVVRFVVQSGRRVPKKRFPTKLVYGRTKNPTLRLITCDGWFNRATGHYVDNYVVFAART